MCRPTTKLHAQRALSLFFSILQSVNIWKPRQRWFLFRVQSQDQLFTIKCAFLGTDRGCPFPEVNLRTSSLLQSVNLQMSTSGPALYYKVKISETKIEVVLVQRSISGPALYYKVWISENQDRGYPFPEVILRTSSLLQSVDSWEQTRLFSLSWAHLQDQLFTTKFKFLKPRHGWSFSRDQSVFSTLEDLNPGPLVV